MLAVFLCLRKLSWFFQKNRVVKPVSKYPYAEQGINSNKAQIKKGFNKTQTKTMFQTTLIILFVHSTIQKCV